MMSFNHRVCLDGSGCPLCFVPAAQQLPQGEMRHEAEGLGYCQKTLSVSTLYDQGNAHRVNATAARKSVNESQWREVT
jgi:hypothetical protein